jgi:hypothetical protein
MLHIYVFVLVDSNSGNHHGTTHGKTDKQLRKKLFSSPFPTHNTFLPVLIIKKLFRTEIVNDDCSKSGCNQFSCPATGAKLNNGLLKVRLKVL